MTSVHPNEPKLRPLIKWPGGKSREMARLRPHLPLSFRAYLEPFVGGGAAFFELAPPGAAFLNDANPRLIDFYLGVSSREPVFVTRLEELAATWDELGRSTERLWRRLEKRIGEIRERPLGEQEARTAAAAAGVPPALVPGVAASITDKLSRVVRLEIKHRVTFPPVEMARHLETAVRAAFYTRIRDAHPPENRWAAAAEFLFVREYCYGSMFRFNAAGKLNIPYGGIAYNRKRFRRKVDRLLSAEVAEQLSRCRFSCLDFQDFFERRARSISPEDFVFLDPPYDSDFSSYDNLAFGLSDHERLAELLAELSAQWLLVIKETPDVERIYGRLSRRTGVTRSRFATAYTYNVRGRNERDSVHLVFRRLRGQ